MTEFAAVDDYLPLRRLAHWARSTPDAIYLTQPMVDGSVREFTWGEVHDSAGSGQHQADPQTRTSEKHAGFFAKEVVEFLKSAYNDGRFERLVLVAEPSRIERRMASLAAWLDPRSSQLTITTRSSAR